MQFKCNPCFLVFQGALRNAIATFVNVSPVYKDTIWSYLEQYDLPVVVGAHVGNAAQPVATQVSLSFLVLYILMKFLARHKSITYSFAFLVVYY